MEGGRKNADLGGRRKIVSNCVTKNDILVADFNAVQYSLDSNACSSLAAFADDGKQPVNYVLLQRQLTPNQQDLELGHGQVHIEINSQRRSKYGAVNKCALSDDELRITLTEDAAEEMRVNQDVRIGLSVTEAQLTELTEFLSELFSGIGEFQRI